MLPIPKNPKWLSSKKMVIFSVEMLTVGLIDCIWNSGIPRCKALETPTIGVATRTVTPFNEIPQV